jgi:hypothetical protein
MATFKELACARYGWPIHQFQRRTFFHCVQPWHQPVLWLLWPWRQRLFGPDLGLIERIGELGNYNDVYQFAQDFADSRRARNLFRDTLGMRPHGRRLLAMARDSLPGRARREGSDGGGPSEGLRPTPEPEDRPGTSPTSESPDA